MLFDYIASGAVAQDPLLRAEYDKRRDYREQAARKSGRPLEFPSFEEWFEHVAELARSRAARLARYERRLQRQREKVAKQARAAARKAKLPTPAATPNRFVNSTPPAATPMGAPPSTLCSTPVAAVLLVEPAFRDAVIIETFQRLAKIEAEQVLARAAHAARGPSMPFSAGALAPSGTAFGAGTVVVNPTPSNLTHTPQTINRNHGNSWKLPAGAITHAKPLVAPLGCLKPRKGDLWNLDRSNTPWWIRLSYLTDPDVFKALALIKLPGWERITDPARIIYADVALALEGCAIGYSCNLTADQQELAESKSCPATWLWKSLRRSLKDALGFTPMLHTVFEIMDGKLHLHGCIEHPGPDKLDLMRQAFLSIGGAGGSRIVHFDPDPDEGWSSYCAKGLLMKLPEWKREFPRVAQGTKPLPGKSFCIDRRLRGKAEETYEIVRLTLQEHVSKI